MYAFAVCVDLSAATTSLHAQNTGNPLLGVVALKIYIFVKTLPWYYSNFWCSQRLLFFVYNNFTIHNTISSSFRVLFLSFHFFKCSHNKDIKNLRHSFSTAEMIFRAIKDGAYTENISFLGSSYLGLLCLNYCVHFFSPFSIFPFLFSL